MPLVVFWAFSFVSRPKRVFYCHFPDLLLTKRETLLKSLYRFFVDNSERVSISFADRVYVNSEFTKSIVYKTFPTLRDIGVHVLYPSLSIEALDVDTSRISFDEADFSGYEHIFLSINRFEVKKNIQLAIEAFSERIFIIKYSPKNTFSADILREQLPAEKFDKCALVLAGGYDPINNENVEHFKELANLAESYELTENIIFLKSPGTFVYKKYKICLMFLDDSQKARLLECCGMVVYTPRNEHFGIVPLEAMYKARCVLAVNAGKQTKAAFYSDNGQKALAI